MKQLQLFMMWAPASRSQWLKLIGCCWWRDSSRWGDRRHAGSLCDTELDMKLVQSIDGATRRGLPVEGKQTRECRALYAYLPSPLMELQGKLDHMVVRDLRGSSYTSAKSQGSSHVHMIFRSYSCLLCYLPSRKYITWVAIQRMINKKWPHRSLESLTVTWYHEEA